MCDCVVVAIAETEVFEMAILPELKSHVEEGKKTKLKGKVEW